MGWESQLEKVSKVMVSWRGGSAGLTASTDNPSPGSDGQRVTRQTACWQRVGGSADSGITTGRRAFPSGVRRLLAVAR